MFNISDPIQQRKRKSIRLFTLALTILSLEACGGGDGNTDAASAVDTASNTDAATTGTGTTTGTGMATAMATAKTAAPAAPTRVQIVLQGQDAQEQSHSALPQNANHQTIAWHSVPGATGYHIYRSVNQGVYTYYANVSASAATSAYSSYVSKSGRYDHQTDVNSAFQDTAATKCVGSYGVQISNGVAKAATATGTYFMPNIGYSYKVSAIGAGGEGVKSTDSMAIFFANGLEITNHPNGWFNGNLVIKDTGATGVSPLGYKTSAKWTTDSNITFINPFSGGAAVDGNFSVKGFKYLIMNVQAAQAGSSFTLAPELSGDQPLLKTYPSSTKYGTLVANKWVQLKIPLSDLLVDQIHGTNAPQYSFYKITMDSHKANEKFWLEWYFSVDGTTSGTGTTTTTGTTTGTGTTTATGATTGAGTTPAPTPAPAPAPTPAPTPAPAPAPTPAPATPTKVQIVLQGQDSQEQSHSALPVNANHLTIAWQSVPGATGYHIYRSVNQGVYTYYANVSASAATSAYSSYVSKSGGYDHQTDVNSAFQDTAAINCVGSYRYQISNGVAKAATATGTYFMPNIGYSYKVTAIGAGGEGAKSTDSMAIFFANGLEITNHPNGWFNGNLVIKDTGATGASPLGYKTSAKWTTDNSITFINPFSGGAAVDGNFSVKGFKYLIMNVQAAQAGSSFTLAPELAGDQPLLKTYPSSSKYGTLVANKWVQLKIPLSDLLVDQIHGTNAPQYSFYKITMDSHKANEKYWLEWYFSVN